MPWDGQDEGREFRISPPTTGGRATVHEGCTLPVLPTGGGLPGCAPPACDDQPFRGTSVAGARDRVHGQVASPRRHMAGGDESEEGARGAALRRARQPTATLHFHPEPNLLQWREPRSVERGNGPWRGWSAAATCGFNGAALRRARKPPGCQPHDGEQLPTCYASGSAHRLSNSMPPCAQEHKWAQHRHL